MSELRPYKIIRNCISDSYPKDTDIVSSSSTVYKNTNIVKVDMDGHDVYKFDVEYYNKPDYIVNEFEMSKTQTIDPIIDPHRELSDVIKKKAKVLANNCTAKIENGFDLEIDGKIKHFSLSVFDQMNIDTQLNNILALGMTKVAYHADGEFCSEFNAIDFIKLASVAKFIILKENTYVNHLIMYIRSLSSAEDVINVQYGDPLQGEALLNFDIIIQSQANIYMEAIKGKGIEINIDEIIAAIL